MSSLWKSASLPNWLGFAAAALALGAYRLGLGAMGVLVNPWPAAAGLAVVALLLTALGHRRRDQNGGRLTRRATSLATASLALLTLGLLAAEVFRPRSPQEVVFVSGELTLAGTLYLPRGGSPPYPAIVITHGAGKQTRDEGRYFARLFARHGIAGLAFDKRGSGRSGGDVTTATYQDLAGDALAALRFLAGRPEIDPRGIGFWGVSEG